MSAKHSRRQILLWSAAATLSAAAVPGTGVAAGAQNPQGPGRPTPPPQEPPSTIPNPAPPRTGAHGDASQPGNVSPPPPDAKTLLKENDKDIKQDVEKLAALADELKKQVEATDSANVLSLGMVHKAEEIEKLARHIASLARG